MNSVKLLTKIKSFRDKDLETCKKLININSWPEYYSDEFFDHENKQLPISVVLSDGHPFQLVDINNINLSNSYSQEYRKGGENSEKPFIRNSLRAQGYFLDVQPIKLRLHKNGVLSVGSGITRLTLLIELGFKNAICAIYKGVEDASDIEVNNAFNVFFFRDNAAHRHSGMITAEDVVFNIKNSVIKGEIDLDPDAIRYQVNAMTEPTPWNEKTKEKIAANIFNDCNNYTDENGKEVIVKSYSSKAAINDFMVNYRDTATIKYMVFSTGSTKKLAYAIGAALKNKAIQEIRLVFHTDKLEAFDLEATYIKRVNDAIAEVKEYWNHLGFLFDEALVSSKVKIYGCLPAISTLTPNMNEMVVFGVNDFFLRNSILTTKTKKAISASLASFMLDDNEETEETEETEEA